MALATYEAMRCPNCQNYDCMVLLPLDLRHVTWGDHGDKAFAVEQYRCLACGAADVIKRDWATQHESDKPQMGSAAPGDGLMFVARPLEDNEK